jgi:hypothetical protein
MQEDPGLGNRLVPCDETLHETGGNLVKPTALVVGHGTHGGTE